MWVGRHPRNRQLFELTHFAGGPGGADNILHVSAPKKRRVEPGALLDLVGIGKTADEDVNDQLLGFVDIDRPQAGKQLVHPEKKGLGSSSPWLRTASSFISSNNVSASLEDPVQFKT